MLTELRQISHYSATNDEFISENFGIVSGHSNLCDIREGHPLAEWLKLKLKSLETIVDDANCKIAYLLTYNYARGKRKTKS